MKLAHQLLNFFNKGAFVGNTKRPFSLLQFVKAFPGETQLYKTIRYCKKLEQEGLLDHMGTIGSHPYYGHHYYTNKGEYNLDLSVYGSYDMLVEGFLSIREKFKNICLPVSVIMQNDEPSIGSSFIYNSETIITAKHCIFGNKKNYILDLEGNNIPVVKVYFPTDKNLDLAVIKTPKSYFDKIESFTISQKPDYMGTSRTDKANFVGERSFVFFAQGNVLDDILTLGYPPLSGFESILIADKSSINSLLLRSSIGQVLTEQKKYYEDIEYLLINAKVKGGNSGGPVFDKLGCLIGIVVEISTDFKNPEMLDKLGYGILIPSKYIKDLLQAIKENSPLVEEQKIKVENDFSFYMI